MATQLAPSSLIRCIDDRGLVTYKRGNVTHASRAAGTYHTLEKSKLLFLQQQGTNCMQAGYKQ
jgi:hypothetical protein